LIDKFNLFVEVQVSNFCPWVPSLVFEHDAPVGNKAQSAAQPTSGLCLGSDVPWI
jgi:hypothetical protein